MATTTNTIAAVDMRDILTLMADAAHFDSFSNNFCNYMNTDITDLVTEIAASYVDACGTSCNCEILHRGIAKHDAAVWAAFNAFSPSSFGSVNRYTNAVAANYHRRVVAKYYTDALSVYALASAANYIVNKYGYNYPLTRDSIRRAAALVSEEKTTPSDLVTTLLGK